MPDEERRITRLPPEQGEAHRLRRPLELNGTMYGGLGVDPRTSGGPECVWCGRPTNSAIFAEGLGREVPMDPTCGMAMMYAYRRWLRGTLRPNSRSTERIIRMLGHSPGAELRALAPGGRVGSCKRCGAPVVVAEREGAQVVLDRSGGAHRHG